MSHLYIIFRRAASRSSHQRNRRNGNAFVHYGDSILLRNILSGFHQVFRQTCDFIINLPAKRVHIRIHAIQQVDTHRNGTHIKILLLDHLVGLQHLIYINHILATGLNTMHFIKNLFALAFHLNTHRQTYLGQLVRQHFKRLFHLR